MPLWSVDVEKKLGEEYWTNRYIVDAVDLEAADDVGDQIAEIEQNVHLQPVLLTKRRTSDMLPGTDIFIVTPLNIFGARQPDSSMLPLFNVARVDFKAATGRPSRKFLRGVLMESETDFDTITPGGVNFIDLTYAQPLEGLPGYVDVDGQELLTGVVVPKIGMRQLRRGSKRRVTPIIP